MSDFCAKCGAAKVPGAAFCPSCGTAFAAKPGGPVKRLVLVLVALVAVGAVVGMVNRPRAAAPAPVATVAVTLEDLVEVDLGSCSDTNGAVGTVTNNSNRTVSIFVAAQFLSEGGKILDDGLDGVSGVRPGETANFLIPYLGPERSLGTCRAELDNVYAD